MKPISSLITQSQTTESKKTGTQLGGCGSVNPSNSLQIAEWLATKAPTDMDKAAVSRAHMHGVTLEVKYEGRYPNNGSSYQVAVGCNIHGTSEQRREALTSLQNFQQPAPQRAIEGWLVELSAITAGKGPDGVDADILLTAYSSRLSTYPADIVRDVLLGKAWKWFPTWEELEKLCEAKASPRRHMIAALSKPPVDPEPKTRPATQEEKDRIQALVDEMFPQKPRAEREAAVSELMKGNCMKESK